MAVVRAGMQWRLAGAASAVVLLLAACAGHDSFVNMPTVKAEGGGEWRLERQVDRITGAPVSNAILITRQVSNGGIVIPPPARLQLACFKERPAVIIAFDFKIGSTRNAEVGYRFDDKPGHEPRVRIVDGYKSMIIEDGREVAQFVNELATSDVLYLHIRSLNTPRTSAEFKVAGAPVAIAAAYASCPINAAAAQASTSARSTTQPRASAAEATEEDDD